MKKASPFDLTKLSCQIKCLDVSELASYLLNSLLSLIFKYLKVFKLKIGDNKMQFKLIILGVLCIFLISPLASACSYHLPAGDDAVDWGKGIQWTGSTKYSSEWNASISTWNAMKKVNISKDTLLTLEDLYIVDVYSPNAKHIHAGYMNSTTSGNNTPFTPAEKQKTLTHELGHALGINEIGISGNVMKQGKSSQTYLGTKDKEVYNCLWG
ncbi:MAG: hypothetical protein LBU81_08400 [Methanosarcinales archaeon]|nr:hypothetical protein [Methanosarcinales archaeon]